MNDAAARTSSVPDEKKYILIALLGFVILAGIGTANHEMWRDEHHAWLLARDAATPLAVLDNLEWDMTPPFWHYVLWVVTRFTHNPAAAQLVNLLFATAAAFVVLRFAPFSLSTRCLVVFSYFWVYEYAVISRVYALGTLFIVIVCSLWARRERHPVLIGVLLFLLANTPSFFGAVAAGFFLILMLWDLSKRPETRKSSSIATAINVSGIFLALYQMMPQPDNPFAQGKMTFAFEFDRFVQIARFVVSVIIPIPDASRYDYWNSNILTGGSVALDILLAGFCLTIPAYLLWRHKLYLVAWSAVVASILFAGYQGQFVGVRHGGFMFVMLVAGLWLMLREEGAEELDGKRRLLFVGLLVVSLVGAATALVKELGTEFTAVDRTAAYLRAEGLDQLPMVGADDFVVASISSVLDLDRIYYPQSRSWGTFVRWSPDRRLHVTLDEVGIEVAEKVRASGLPFVVLLTRPPTRLGPRGEEIITSAQLGKEVHIRFLAAFTDSVVADERLYVYLAERKTRTVE